ncbi:MAG: hypothetical protein QXP38_04305 [Nitrososphaerota archaeon]
MSDANGSSVYTQGSHLVEQTSISSESKILGKKGNAISTESDIVEVEFELKGNYLNIKYKIAGKFYTNNFYFVNIYDAEYQEWDNMKYTILFGYFESKHSWVAFVYDASEKLLKDLKYYVSDSVLTITGLTIDDIGHKYIFYASAEIFNMKNGIIVDIEPRAPLGNLIDSLKYHTCIALPVNVSFNLVGGATVTIDDMPYPMPYGTLDVTLVAGTHVFKASTLVNTSKGERYVFEQWGDGSREASRKVFVDRPSKYSATYKKQYYLNVTSPIGEVKGSGWYDSGSTANIMLSETSAPMQGWLGILGGRIAFNRWSGDLTGEKSSATIRMDSPKTVQAVWIENYTLPIIILLGIIIGVGLISGTAVMRFRLKSRAAVIKPEAIVTPQPQEPAKPALKSPLILEYEKLKNELSAIKQKLAKLTDSYTAGIVSEEAYNTLRTDYEEKASNLDHSIRELESKITAEIQSLTKEEEKINKELELLEARKLVGEIDEKQYSVDKSKLISRLDEIRRKKKSLSIIDLNHQ